MKFENQRVEMVESQLRPNLVLNENILQAFSAVRREKYFSVDLRSISYMDDNIFINKDSKSPWIGRHVIYFYISS